MGTRCGIYVRISDDRDGHATGVTRQEADCRQLADVHGWTVTHVYAENDTSAFKRRKVHLPDGTTALRVVRPQFRAMLDDLTDGSIDAIIGYDLDRVARDPRDLEDLIDACETTGRPAKSVTGNLDLSHDGGVTLARVAVAIANQSSRDTSRRVRRAKAAAADAGKWGGGGKRAYGYTADRTALVPAEAKVVRWMAEQTIAGTPLRALVADLNDRHVPTVTGGAWSTAAARRILVSGVAAGRLNRHGKDAGPAAWPAILDESTWRAVVDELDGRPRSDTRLAHWLTGIAICGLCGHALRGNRGAYLCNPASGGCNRIWVNERLTDEVVSEAVLARAERAGVPTIAPPPPLPDDSQLVELAAMWGAGEITRAEYQAARAGIVARLQVPAPARVRVPAWMSGDLRAQWPVLDAARRRTVAGVFLDAVVVRASPTRRFSPDRLELRWR